MTDMRLRIRELLEERGWTQADLSERSGMAQPEISRLATGARPYRQSHVERLAAAFRVSPSELLDEPGKESRLVAMIRQFESLSEAEQEQALGYMRSLAQRRAGQPQPTAPKISD